MSRDVLEIVQKMDSQGLEWQLAMQCAPLLLRKKISNLLMLPVSCEGEIPELLRDSDLDCFVLGETKSRVTMLIYRAAELDAYRKQPEIAEILRDEGYPEAGLEDTLRELRRRYERCRNGEDSFPHEMGIFLGYPAEDVRGFIRDHGQHSLYSGYWKVYADVEKKKRIFRSYEEARDTVVRMLHRGIALEDILTGEFTHREKRSA